jgi:hypothetical protein
MARDIDDIFRSLDEDERFKGAGLSRGRGVMEDVLVWEIRISDFDLDAETLDYLNGFAEREGLILNVDNGNVVLSRRPQGVA